MTSKERPLTLSDLESLIQEIRSGQSEIRLSKQSLNLLGKILTNPQDIAIKSISQISDDFNVNPSTITRLVRKLGYVGFKAFQLSIRQSLVEPEHFYSQQTSRLSSSSSVFGQEAENLRTTEQLIDYDLVQKVAESILGARKVHILALRGCFGAAHYLYYYLGFLHEDVHILGSEGFMLAEELCRVNQDDVFIAIALPPETNLTVEIYDKAKSLGAKTVGFSASAYSVMESLSDFHFPISVKGTYYFNPLASLFAALESLLLEVCNLKGEHAVVMMKEREQMFAALNTESRNR